MSRSTDSSQSNRLNSASLFPFQLEPSDFFLPITRKARPPSTNPPPISRRNDRPIPSDTMGIWETLTDLAEAALPWSAAEAEAPAAEEEKVRTFPGVRRLS